MKHIHLRIPPQRSTTWAGLLLAFLLALFLVALAGVAWLFLSWGKAVVTSVPDMPDLALPRLVRSAPSFDKSSSGLDRPWQPAGVLGTQQQAAERRLTVLIMGVDNRPDEKVEKTRTDTIMVLTVNPKSGAAGMLSIPRDLVVFSPVLNREVKINTLHVSGYTQQYPGGGPQLLKDAVSDLVGYPIDYYVRANFDGFRQIVDLAGGIDIDVPEDIHDPLYPDDNYGYEGFDLPAGRQHMDGALALKYARTRHTDSDYGRAARQQQVILALRDRLLQPGQIAALLPRLPGLALTLANSIQTDMPVDQAVAMARMLDKADLKNPSRIVIDNTMGTQVSDDPELGFALRPNMTKIRAATADIFTDTPSAASEQDALRQAVKAEGARIIVLNGSRQGDLETEMATTLSDDGYQVVAVGLAETGDTPQTSLITYGDGNATTREALLRRFNIPSSRIISEPPSPDADLALVLGDDLIVAPNQGR